MKSNKASLIAYFRMYEMYCGKVHLNWSIEMLQLLLRLGTFQLSDLFYNTVGGVLGGLMYYTVMKVRRHL